MAAPAADLTLTEALTSAVCKSDPDIRLIASRVARRNGALLVKDISDNKRVVTQRLLRKAVDYGWSPQMLQEQLATVIGLDERGYNAVENFRMSKAVQDLPPGIRRRRVKEYATRLRAARALTIAKTELAKAQADAQRIGWIIKQDKGELSRSAVRRVNYNPGCCSRVCKDHQDDEYQIRDVDGPPYHPNCTCTEYLFDPITKAEPKDGDGDGKVYDGTPRERPALPSERKPRTKLIPRRARRPWKPNSAEEIFSRNRFRIEPVNPTAAKSGEDYDAALIKHSSVEALFQRISDSDDWPLVEAWGEKHFTSLVDGQVSNLKNTNEKFYNYQLSLKNTADRVFGYLDKIESMIPAKGREDPDWPNAESLILGYLGGVVGIQDRDAWVQFSNNNFFYSSFGKMREINGDPFAGVEEMRDKMVRLKASADQMIKIDQLEEKLHWDDQQWRDHVMQHHMDKIRLIAHLDSREHPEFSNASIAIYAEIGRVIDEWAGSSYDESLMAIAWQKYIQEHYGVGTMRDTGSGSYLNYDSEPVLKTVEERKAIWGPLADAMYEQTQQKLQELGIESLRLFRGQGPGVLSRGGYKYDRYGGPKDFQIPAEMNPLTSWATSYDQAMGFNSGTILTAEIPAEEIFSWAGGGLGCWSEDEVVVLGKTAEVHVRVGDWTAIKRLNQQVYNNWSKTAPTDMQWVLDPDQKHVGMFRDDDGKVWYGLPVGNGQTLTWRDGNVDLYTYHAPLYDLITVARQWDAFLKDYNGEQQFPNLAMPELGDEQKFFGWNELDGPVPVQAKMSAATALAGWLAHGGEMPFFELYGVTSITAPGYDYGFMPIEDFRNLTPEEQEAYLRGEWAPDWIDTSVFEQWAEQRWQGELRRQEWFRQLPTEFQMRVWRDQEQPQLINALYEKWKKDQPWYFDVNTLADDAPDISEMDPFPELSSKQDALGEKVKLVQSQTEYAKLKSSIMDYMDKFSVPQVLHILNVNPEQLSQLFEDLDANSMPPDELQNILEDLMHAWQLHQTAMGVSKSGRRTVFIDEKDQFKSWDIHIPEDANIIEWLTLSLAHEGQTTEELIRSLLKKRVLYPAKVYAAMLGYLDAVDSTIVGKGGSHGPQAEEEEAVLSKDFTYRDSLPRRVAKDDDRSRRVSELLDKRREKQDG